MEYCNVIDSICQPTEKKKCFKISREKEKRKITNDIFF